jgi:hypothetical protein
MMKRFEGLFRGQDHHIKYSVAVVVLNRLLVACVVDVVMVKHEENLTVRSFVAVAFVRGVMVVTVTDPSVMERLVLI